MKIGKSMRLSPRPSPEGRGRIVQQSQGGRRAQLLAAWTLCLCLAALNSVAQSADPKPVLANWGGLPLFFESYPEATGGLPQFVARGRNFHLLLSPTGARFELSRTETTQPFGAAPGRTQFTGQHAVHTRTLNMQFVGADPQAVLFGEGMMPGKINHLAGNEPRRWHSGVSTYAQVSVKGLYPGIDLTYYGNARQLEYDFTVAPGADPARIALRFDEADAVSVDERGELVVTLGDQELRQPMPAIYQVVAGLRRPVEGGFRLRDGRTVEFAANHYDRGLPLVIDPVLSYSTYFSGNEGDTALAVKVDSSGSIYVAGITLADAFVFTPTNTFQLTNAGGIIDGDAFVAKLDSTGTNLIYFTYLGGTNDDGALDMALDSSNNVYLTGFTDSADFPVVPKGGIPGLKAGAHIGGVLNTNVNRFPVDAFIAELDASGSNLIFSTFLGGSDADIAGGIALDPSNNIYVTGVTYSTNFPTTNALVLSAPVPGTTVSVMNQLVGTNAAFITKLAPAGSGVVYSTFLGGSNVNEGQGIAADAAGFAYVTGFTAATNFPLTANAFQTNFNHSTNAHHKYFNIRHPATDAFVAQIAPQGSNLLYCTYLGGTNHDAGNRIVVDANTNVYVTGYSESPDFTNTVSRQVVHPGVTNLAFRNADAFLTKFDFSGPSPLLVYSALFGGKQNDTGWAVAVDAVGNAFVVGSTGSLTNNFPTVNTNGYLSATNRGSNDVFVTVFNTNATALLYSVLLGGNSDDLGYGIALDAQDNAYIVGQTVSTNFPTVSPFGPPVQRTNAFIAKIILNVPSNTVTIQTLPTNLTLIVDGVATATPLTTNWLLGSIHTIAAPSTNTDSAGTQYLWQSWSDGGFQSHHVMINGDMTFTANFTPQSSVTNSLPMQGNYAGLFYDTNNPSITNSGSFTMALASNGRFTAKLLFVGRTFSVSGQFSASGYYSNSIPRLRLPSLLLAFQLDRTGGNSMSGLINNGLSTAQLLANRNVFSSAHPAPESGKKYTLAIPGGPNSLAQPEGFGAASVSVSRSGLVQFGGTLGDGTRVSQGAFVSAAGMCPIFIPLYADHGVLFGWLSFSNQPASTNQPAAALGGTVVWIKEPRNKSRVYPSGFTIVSQTIGSTYSGVPALTFNQGHLVLDGGNLGENITNAVSIASGTITSSAGLPVNLTVFPASGLFRGTIFNPNSRKSLPVNGALLQNQDFGAGAFMGTNQSGLLLLQP